jgi:alkylation response protein AidB-like acyl-CoA dehydrogenase
VTGRTEQHARYPDAKLPLDDLTTVFAEIQSAKAFVGDVAVRIVDRTLALSGGGYMNASPPAGAYRDVRATAFMHPLGANRDYTFLADIAAGRVPELH